MRNSDVDEIGLLKVTRIGEPPAEGAVEQECQVTVERYTISADDVAVCMTVAATTVGEAGSSSPYLPPTYSYALSATVADGSC
ncbi:hypothetical protein [Saccharopolyspora sp. NPDC050642]|uniref:hypothetical protein n=1 Tax=Saccharopolyspora sp. NPDC050642 TaxID=3157099 RepID=UPI0034049C7C